MPSRDEAFKTYRPRWLISAAVILLLSGCSYVQLLLPSVLQQFNPDLVFHPC
jgi:hypothetical protein